MKRGWLAVAIVVVVVCGLLSRRDGLPVPELVRGHAGDILWATMVALGLAVLRPDGKAWVMASAALAIACAVECSQLYRAPWLDAVRSTVPGHLILGRGFLWSDLLRYGAGALLGYGLLRVLPRRDG